MMAGPQTPAVVATRAAALFACLLWLSALPALAQRPPVPPGTTSSPAQSGFPNLDAGRPPPNVEVLRRVESTARLVLISSLLFIVFAITAYMLLRRRPSRDDGPAPRTEYVDAWAAYRLKPESIAAATLDPPEDEPPQRDNGPGRPPRRRPDPSDSDPPPEGGNS
ncbi:MAG: hypothetical protein IPM64_00480 [Phycisphaerales bacterium]|nr:hypothetical protein [Phycisphaerales bacterium]